MTDPISDMLTRIRNAVRVERPHVELPLSKVKRGLAEHFGKSVPALILAADICRSDLLIEVEAVHRS